MSSITLCGCGRPLHYTDKRFEALICDFVAEKGECVEVSNFTGSYLVPRHFIALHGLRSSELQSLAKRYGWSKVT